MTMTKPRRCHVRLGLVIKQKLKMGNIDMAELLLSGSSDGPKGVPGELIPVSHGNILPEGLIALDKTLITKENSPVLYGSFHKPDDVVIRKELSQHEYPDMVPNSQGLLWRDEDSGDSFFRSNTYTISKFKKNGVVELYKDIRVENSATGAVLYSSSLGNNSEFILGMATVDNNDDTELLYTYSTDNMRTFTNLPSFIMSDLNKTGKVFSSILSSVKLSNGDVYIFAMFSNADYDVPVLAVAVYDSVNGWNEFKILPHVSTSGINRVNVSVDVIADRIFVGYYEYYYNYSNGTTSNRSILRIAELDLTTLVFVNSGGLIPTSYTDSDQVFNFKIKELPADQFLIGINTTDSNGHPSSEYWYIGSMFYLNRTVTDNTNLYLAKELYSEQRRHLIGVSPDANKLLFCSDSSVKILYTIHELVGTTYITNGFSDNREKTIRSPYAGTYYHEPSKEFRSISDTIHLEFDPLNFTVAEYYNSDVANGKIKYVTYDG